MLVVIYQQHQLVFLANPAGPVQLHLVAELTLQDCGLEGGTDGERQSLDPTRVVRDCWIRLERTKWDESRGPYSI